MAEWFWFFVWIGGAGITIERRGFWSGFFWPVYVGKAAATWATRAAPQPEDEA